MISFPFLCNLIYETVSVNIMYKIPLRYQATEYDCGSAAIINAINYAFDFSEIPAYFLKEIYDVCLDEYNENGLFGGHGTSLNALRYLADWFNRYRETHGFPIHCLCVDGEDVTFIRNTKLLDILREKETAIVLRCMLYNEHYITLTDADDEYIYLFDPYYWIKDYGDSQILRVSEPMRANRKLPISFMETTEQNCYNINTVKEKLAVVFSRKP